MSGLPTFWGNKTSQSAAGPSTYAPGGSNLALHGIKVGTQTTLAANCDWCRLFCWCKDCEAKTSVSFAVSGFVNADASWIYYTDTSSGTSLPLTKEHTITGLTAINGTYNWSVSSDNANRKCVVSGSRSISIGNVTSRARQQRRQFIVGTDPTLVWSDWEEIVWAVSIRIGQSGSPSYHTPNQLWLDFVPTCGTSSYSFNTVSHAIADWKIGTADCFEASDNQCKVWPAANGIAKNVFPLSLRKTLLSGCASSDHPTAECYKDVATLPVAPCSRLNYYPNPGFYWINSTGSTYGLYSGPADDIYELNPPRRLSKSVPQVCLLNRYCPDIRVDSNGEERVDSDGNTRVIS